MAFKFNFDVDGDLDETSTNSSDTICAAAGPSNGLEHDVLDLRISDKDSEPARLPFQELSLDQLIDTLPPVLSYSAVEIPLTRDGKPTGSTATVLRRDLFDARFQLANEEDDSDDEGSAFGNMIPRTQSPPKGLGFSRADTDLIKGVYEGGLKTWEASLDLVDCLHERGFRDGENFIHGTSVLELGCGSALPTLYLLELFFKKCLEEEKDSLLKGKNKERTRVHLQDYNSEVLLYITFCNVLLAFWHARQETSTDLPDAPHNKDASLPKSRKTKRAKTEEEVAYTVEEDTETEINELALPPELIESFTSFLDNHNIELKFFTGGWESFPDPEKRYDVILTSETVYDLENLPHLGSVLRKAAKAGQREQSDDNSQLTLVACKRVYFGVGGGEYAFKSEVGDDGEVTNVWNSTEGVERTVMRVQWR